MYGPFDPVPQPPPVQPTGLKRTRSTSPSSLYKKRPPPDYNPAIYTSLPPHLAPSPSNNSPHASGSGSSTPSDWVRRTEGLQLATPPCEGAVAYGWDQQGATSMEEDVGMGGPSQDAEMDSMMDSDDLPSHPHPANARSSQAHLHSAFTQPNSSRAYDPPAQPHHAPPLHFHLAGSPQPDAASAGLSRSSSASSNSSMSLSPHHNRTGYHQQHHRQPPPLAEEVPMPTMAQKKTGGGWKVTFGFRHDCQKCLDKVPGHYSHVVSDEGVFSGR